MIVVLSMAIVYSVLCEGYGKRLIRTRRQYHAQWRVVDQPTGIVGRGHVASN